MIKSFDDVKVGLFKYDMSNEFANSAITCVKEICEQSNVFCSSIPNCAKISFWNDVDTGKRLYDLPAFKDYLSFVKPHIREYLTALGISEDDAVVTAMWGVHYKPDQFVQRHNHTYEDYHKGPYKKVTNNDVLAILLYLNKPDNSGNLFIETSDGIEHEIDLKGGDIIMFPSSSTMHRTNPNKSKEDKFIVGIELVMKWVTDDNLVGKMLEEL